MYKAMFGQSAPALPAPHGQAGERRAEIAFLDPASPDLGTLLSRQPRGAEAATPGAQEPAAEQIAHALAGRRGLATAQLGVSGELEAPKGLRVEAAVSSRGVEDRRGALAAKAWLGGGRTGADLMGWLIADGTIGGGKFLSGGRNAFRWFNAPFDAERISESDRKRLKVVTADCTPARLGAALH